MDIKVTKIFATCTYKRFMWVDTGECVICLRISQDMYNYLRKLGVPTAQSMRCK